MARGIVQFYARITTDTDTELVAAPSSNLGLPQRINIRWITCDVEVASASGTLRLEDGAGSGNILGTLDCSDDNNRLDRVYHIKGGSKGLKLSENTALSAETANVAGGGVVVIRGEVEIT